MTYEEIKEMVMGTKDCTGNKFFETLANKAEKYRWHDLRKNPEDLPPIAITVMAIVNNDYCAVVRYSDDWCYSHVNCLHLLEDDAKVIAWKYIEPYEVAE